MGSPFEIDDIITGVTSLATAKVIGVFGDDESGVLSLTDVEGTFQDEESITGSGPANVDGGVSQLTLDYDNGDGGLFTKGNIICSPVAS